MSNALYKNQVEVMDGGNPYGLDDFNNFNKFNDFNDDTLNNFYISNSSSNNYSSIVSNNSITPTVESKTISVDYIIFFINKWYAKETSIDLVSDSNYIS